MSRFQKAMERDRAGGARPKAEASAGILPDEIPPAELFDSPWRLREPGDSPAPPAAAEASSAAAAIPPTSPATVPSAVRRAAAAPAPASAPTPWPVQPVTRPTPVGKPVTRMTGLKLRPDLAEKVVSDAATSAVVVEQYRSLAAHLQHWRGQRGRATLMVASAVAGEGRTLTAVNLAVSLRSALQHSVLLVDADLRKPSLHDVLLVEQRPGIGEALVAGIPPPLVEVSKRLSILPAGQPIATPGAATLAALVESVASDFDWVVLDTSPLLDSLDTQHLATQVDGVLLVAAAGRTSHRLVAAALGLIPEEKFAGLVLNGVASGDMDAAEQHRYRSQR